MNQLLQKGPMVTRIGRKEKRHTVYASKEVPLKGPTDADLAAAKRDVLAAFRTCPGQADGRAAVRRQLRCAHRELGVPKATLDAWVAEGQALARKEPGACTPQNLHLGNTLAKFSQTCVNFWQALAHFRLYRHRILKVNICFAAECEC